MSSKLGTIVMGIRTPIIKEGDNLANIVVESVLEASNLENIEIEDRDIIAITEAVVGISEGNYATIDQIAEDLRNKIDTKHIGIVFPILSRNRFAVLLKAFARTSEKITCLLSYPSDEVGNDILQKERLAEYNIDPYKDIITEEEYKTRFGDFKHIFTGVNMIDFYREVATSENCEINFILSNNPEEITKYTTNILVCDIHSREETKEKIKKIQNTNVVGIDEILNNSINGSGYNEKYGLLGSNRATEDKVKLFPRACEELVNKVQEMIKEHTGKTVEVMVYGDGAFKDPVGKIWELADPVVSPAYTKGLEGSPNELKLKYLSDNKYNKLKGEELSEAIKKEIKEKEQNLKGKIETQGTTPRRYVDLIGSLCDLTSGSGDKGTPVVYIKNYFKNYAD